MKNTFLILALVLFASPLFAAMWKCTAMDSGHEEHFGGHPGYGYYQWEAEENAIYNCQKVHKSCYIQNCETDTGGTPPPPGPGPVPTSWTCSSHCIYQSPELPSFQANAYYRYDAEQQALEKCEQLFFKCYVEWCKKEYYRDEQ